MTGRHDPPPSLIRGRAYWAVSGYDLETGSEAAMVITAPDPSTAVARFIEHNMIGEVWELTPGEYPAWHNWAQSFAPGQLRLPQPNSGVRIGVLEAEQPQPVPTP